MHEYLYAITFREQSRPAAIARINELARAHSLLIKAVVAGPDNRALYVTFIAREAVTELPQVEHV
jgi:hypothetical protein